MKITELTYSYGRTLQVEAFNPINIHASVKAEVSESEDIDLAYAQLHNLVIRTVNEDIENAIQALRNPQPKARKPYTPNPYRGISDNQDAFGNPIIKQ